MSKSMAQLASETKQITIATMFSGGEMFFMCLVGLMSIVAKMFGVTLEPQLEWNVEKDFWKREFSNSRFPPKHSFDDLIALSNNGWSGTDSISGEKHSLYTTDICAAGFECDTVCKLARDSSSSTCMEAMTGKTGTTGRATLMAIVHFRLERVGRGGLVRLLLVGQSG